MVGGAGTYGAVQWRDIAQLQERTAALEQRTDDDRKLISDVQAWLVRVESKLDRVIERPAPR